MAWLLAGAGVEADFQKAGITRHLRFGSQAYVSEGLADTEAASIAAACQQQGADEVISVLMESSARQQPAETRSAAFVTPSLCMSLHSHLTGTVVVSTHVAAFTPDQYCCGIHACSSIHT